jgi:DNA-binding response OmpR family regulator
MLATVLLVDDDSVLTFLIQRAIAKAKIKASLRHLESCEEAIKYLSGKCPYEDRSYFPFPSVVLLDLKLPRLEGFELLQWVREQPEPLKSTPIIVWTYSDVPADRVNAFTLGATSYVVKPKDSNDLAEVVTKLRRFCEGVHVAE